MNWILQMLVGHHHYTNIRNSLGFGGCCRLGEPHHTSVVFMPLAISALQLCTTRSSRPASMSVLSSFYGLGRGDFESLCCTISSWIIPPVPIAPPGRSQDTF